MALHSQWRTGTPEAFSRQPYEALAVSDGSPSYGSQQLLPTLTGPANFSTRYYDTGVDPRSFPMMGGQAATTQQLQRPQEKRSTLGGLSMESNSSFFDSDNSAVAAGSTWSDSTARNLQRTAKRQKTANSKAVPMSDYARYMKDHMSRFFLWWGAVCVSVFGVFTAFVGVEALLSDEFQVVSLIAWDSWFPSFSAMMLLLVVISACSIAAGALAFWVGWKESRPALRAFFVSSATLGIIVLCMALFAWLYRQRARPFVLSAANLLCQDVKPFGCPPLSTTLPPASTGPTVAPVQALPLTYAPAPVPVPTIPEPPMPATAGNSISRRLVAVGSSGRGAGGAAAAAAAASFVARFAGDRGAEQQGNRSLESRRLNAAKSALAFGSSYGHDPDVSGLSELCRMLQKLCVPPISFNPATSCVCSGAWRRKEMVGSDVDDSFQDERRRLQATQLRAPARRLTEEAPGPWQGTQGSFCGSWEPDDAQGPWCFVSAFQTCGKESAKTYKDQAGQQMTRSGGPCTDEVESRSQYVLDGLAAMAWPLQLSAVLGVLLLTMSACGVLLYRVPSTATVWTAAGSRRNSEEQRGGSEAEHKQRSQELSIQKRFANAEREAMKRLSNSTPDEDKLALYGIYQQAKEGDVRTDRPGFFNHYMRSKWDAWAQHRGMPQEEAMEAYIKMVQHLGQPRQ